MKAAELMYYGRYYRDNDELFQIWWYDPNGDCIYQYEDLLKKFGYTSQEDIINSGVFVPLFQTDIITLEHKFIEEMNDKKIITYFKNISDHDFSREFNIFIEENFLTDSWNAFEKKYLYEDALKWCRDNCIKSIDIL